MPIESWMSVGTLSNLEQYEAILKSIEESSDSLHVLNQWLAWHPIINVSDREPLHRWQDLKLQDDSCSIAGYNDSTWKVMSLRTVWERSSL